MAKGLDITRRVYERLRKPDTESLPYQVIVNNAQDVIARKKLDLTLSAQNNFAVTSEWFGTSSNDFALTDVDANFENIFLPIRVEVGNYEDLNAVGCTIPIVNYEVFPNAPNNVVSFYGNPMRMALNGYANNDATRRFRITYEPDFENINGLKGEISLPAFFTGMIVSETMYMTVLTVEDNSPEWQMFVKQIMRQLEVEIADWRQQWAKFVKKFLGRGSVVKRTFLDNRRGRGFRKHPFRGDFQ